MELVRETSPLRDRLAQRRVSNESQQEYLDASRQWLVAAKKWRQSEKGLPPEKSPI